jgi:hypothetical protein
VLHSNNNFSAFACRLSAAAAAMRPHFRGPRVLRTVLRKVFIERGNGESGGSIRISQWTGPVAANAQQYEKAAATSAAA